MRSVPGSTPRLSAPSRAEGRYRRPPRSCVRSAGVWTFQETLRIGVEHALAVHFAEGTEFDGEQAQEHVGLALLTAFLATEAFDTGDVGHVGLLLESNQLALELLLQTIRSLQHPIQDAKQLRDGLAAVAALGAGAPSASSSLCGSARPCSPAPSGAPSPPGRRGWNRPLARPNGRSGPAACTSESRRSTRSPSAPALLSRGCRRRRARRRSSSGASGGRIHAQGKTARLFGLRGSELEPALFVSSGFSMFSAVPGIAELSSTPPAVRAAEEDDCTSSILGCCCFAAIACGSCGSLLCSATHGEAERTGRFGLASRFFKGARRPNRPEERTSRRRGSTWAWPSGGSRSRRSR